MLNISQLKKRTSFDFTLIDISMMLNVSKKFFPIHNGTQLSPTMYLQGQHADLVNSSMIQLHWFITLWTKYFSSTETITVVTHAVFGCQFTH